jgi:hypothetical protein
MMMNITKRDIDNFNRGVRPSVNEEYNKAKGIYSRDVYLKLRAIKDSQWGTLSMPIMMRHVEEWIDYI